MDDVFKDTVHFVDGINVRQLMQEKSVEFSIDLDFKKKSGNIYFPVNEDDLLADFDDEQDSDPEDVLKNIEQSAERALLSCPDYHSFDQLATKMVDCLPSGEVKMLIIEEGDGPLVPPDAEVRIHHAAYYEKCDEPFDTTLTMDQGKPLRIRMGIGKMLPGLEIGLSSVKGPTARFLLMLQPSVAWGPRGVMPRIQPKPVLFVIMLYDVRCVDAAARFNDLPMAEQSKYETAIKTVTCIRDEAKDLFKRKKFVPAIRSYQQAMNVLSLCQPQNENEEKDINDLKVKIYLNLAVCYYKINKPKYIIGVCQHIDRCVDINTHCKAMFYYGRAYEMLGQRDKAIYYYKKALKLEPKNTEIGKILADIDAKTIKSESDEKIMWRKALSSGPLPEEKVAYKVDDDFKNGVFEMCQDLAGRSGFAKFDLSMGLSKNEVDCIKDLASKFDCLVVQENGEDKMKHISIVKKDL